MVAAGRHDLLALGNELDDALGAGVGTCAAANTAGTVDLCNAIDDMYRVELAGAGCQLPRPMQAKVQVLGCSCRRTAWRQRQSTGPE